MTAAPQTADLHGFIHDLDEPTYHGHPTSLSVTGAKVLLKAPALYQWQRTHPVHKDVFDFGSAAHALVLGVGAPIDVIDADSWRTKSAQEARDTARAAGHLPLLPADHQRVQDMADALSGHTLAMQLLSDDGHPEVSAFAPDEETGVLRRCRFDWLGPRVLTDYKTSATADPRELAGRYGVVRKFGYDQQIAWYTDLARDLGHPAEAFALIVQSKEAPYLVTVAYVPDDDLWDARQRNRLALERFRDCTAAGVWPGYLPSNTAAVLSLTEQTYEEEQI